MTDRVGRPSRTEVVCVSAACGYAVLLAVATALWDYDIWGALVVAPLLVAVTLPMLRRIADRDGLEGIFPLLVTALVVKLAMAVPRWAMAFVLYDGSADAARYDAAGKAVAPLYRQLVFPTAEIAGGSGTKMLANITGGVYAVIGPSLLGGFVVFSWLGFWGLVGCYRAARVALPQLDARRYAGFLFFLPSMAFWPSSIGKDAVITLGIGLTVYGVARLLKGGPAGLMWAVPGVAVVFLIRPHIAALLATASAAAFLLRAPLRRTALTPVIRVAGVVAVGALGLAVTYQAASSLGIDGTESFTEERNFRSEKASQGGSAFEANAVTSPTDVPGAMLTVLYRPFPWEADNVQMLVASAEGMLLLGVTVLSYRRLCAAALNLRTAYIALCVLYLLGFVYAFAGFGNFGILARQRVQALPFLLVLLALRPGAGTERRPPPTRATVGSALR